MAEGLVKMSRVHHEKDDRPKVADPRYFILGWLNGEKIRLLSDDLAGHKDTSRRPAHGCERSKTRWPFGRSVPATSFVSP